MKAFALYHLAFVETQYSWSTLRYDNVLKSLFLHYTATNSIYFDVLLIFL